MFVIGKMGVVMDANVKEKVRQLRAGEIRAIGKQRARKLKRNGIPTWWDKDLMTYVWRP